MAKKNDETKAPRMSQIERLQQQLEEAKAKAEAREQKKVDSLFGQYALAIARAAKAAARCTELERQLLDLGVHQEDLDNIEVASTDQTTEVE